jgi:plasmid maintenance system antidote protein VapI
MKAYLEINKKMKSEGRTWAWLARKIGVTRGLVSQMMAGYTPITEENLIAINKVLQTNFTNGKQKSSKNLA